MRKRIVKQLSIVGAAAAIACVFAGSRANADITVGVDPAQTWVGYMNVSDLPANGGAYEFGSVWATADLPASFTGGVATLGPNTNIDRDNPIDTANGGAEYWWQPPNDGTSPGDKNMAASFYVQNNAAGGQTVTFTGDVLSNTLVSPYTSVAFIDDFTTGYALVNTVTTPLTPGDFSISLPINAGDILQYGFITTGPNARLADAPSLGSVQVTAVPEPASLGLLAVGGLMVVRRRRR